MGYSAIKLRFGSVKVVFVGWGRGGGGAGRTKLLACFPNENNREFCFKRPPPIPHLTPPQQPDVSLPGDVTRYIDAQVFGSKNRDTFCGCMSGRRRGGSGGD